MKKPTKVQSKKSPKKKTTGPNRLEKATAVYFASMSKETAKEENRLGAAMAAAARQVDFDAH